MSWITIVWSMASAVCGTLALIHLAIWFQRRSQVVHLLFALTALGAAGNVLAELGMLKATTVEGYATALRASFVPLILLVISMPWYIRSYFGTGRRSLAAAITVVWAVVLIIDAFSPFSPVFSEISGLRITSTPWGEPFALAKGVIHPLNLVISVGDLIFLVFVVDASATFWRRGERRRAMLFSIGIVGGSLVAAIVARMIDFGVLQMPYVTTFIYIGVIVVFGYPLTLDVVRTAQLARQLQESEAELRESEERFRIVADSAPVLIWMSGLDKLCTFFNRAWLEFTGRTMEQEMGNGWAEGVHPDDFQRCLQTYVGAFDARQPFVMQYRLRRHDGEYRWISDNGVPRYDAEKNFAGYIGSCLDVTELINKEQALRDSEERMSLAAEAAGLVMWTRDIRRDEISLSDRDRAFFGFAPREKLNGDRIRSVVHPEDREFVRQLVENSIGTRDELAAEYRVVLPDGKVRWVTRRGRVEFDDNGAAICERGVLMDITERKQAEEKFRLAVEASPIGIILVNDKGRIVLVNAQTEKLFGYAREEIINQPVEILVPERFRGVHPGHRARFLAAPEARAMGAGRELFGRRKDDSEFPVEIGLNPIKTSDGMLVLAAIVDISARKQAELDAQRHRSELAHLSRVSLMGEMAASLAHELNQPLAGIVNNAAAGQRFIDHGNITLLELRELLVDISADGRRASEVVRGIRSMVKKGAMIRQQINLNDVVKKVVQIANPDALLRGCEVKTSLEPTLPAIEGDPIQLQQVLLNLVINAFDAMRDTPAANRKVEITTEWNGDSAIRTTVRDYGVGISEETRERLFDPFFTTKAEGLGMGLAIVRSIVESHASKIVAENVEGGGARFHFSLLANAAASK
jgi:PAS domain S-box-containing protein